MGNQLCCEAEIGHSLIPSNIQKQQSYYDAFWPEGDDFIQQQIKKNEFQSQFPLKVRKHIATNKYFYINWVNQRPHGKGILYEPGEYLYHGDFNQGEATGEATIKFIHQNSVYNGDVEKGKAHGEGSYDNPSQNYIFEGKWKNSKPQSGILSLTKDPNVKQINFDNFIQKKGRVSYCDGRQFIGYLDLEKLVPDGIGKVIFSKNNQKESYEGEWKKGKMHGKGIFVWKDRSIYDGEYHQNKKEGFGKFVYSSGKIYEGYWKEGKQHGTGIMFDKVGVEQKRGLWKAGNMEKTLSNEEWKKQNIIYEDRYKPSSTDILDEQSKKEIQESPIKQEQNLQKREQMKKQMENSEILDIENHHLEQEINKNEVKEQQKKEQKNHLHLDSNNNVILKQTKSEYESEKDEKQHKNLVGVNHQPESEIYKHNFEKDERIQKTDQRQYHSKLESKEQNI